MIGGPSYADALAASEAWAAGSGAMPIHAYDQVETILGQGSVGLEIEGAPAARELAGKASPTAPSAANRSPRDFTALTLSLVFTSLPLSWL